MSTSVREPDNGCSKDEPLSHVPKKLRHPERDLMPAGSPGAGDAAAQMAASQSGRTPWKRSRNGDSAPQNAAPEPGQAPWQRFERYGGPPSPPSADVKNRLAIRLTGVVVVLILAAVGYQLAFVPPAPRPRLSFRSGQSDLQGSASLRPVPSALQSAAPPFHSSAGAKTITPRSDEQGRRRDASPRAVSGGLTIGAVGPLQEDEAAVLVASAAPAGANAAVVIGGLEPGWTLSTGMQLGPNTWRLPLEELDGASVTPPRGFIGAIDLTLELRLADNTVADRKGLHLEWSGDGARESIKSQQRHLPASETAVMVEAGTEHMKNGSIGAARMMFQSAAEAGDAIAAFALAETYDPLVLKKLNAKGGITADIGLAQAWYQKAKDLGSTAAPERLNRLAHVSD
jgi:hypothetical protein